MPDDFLELVMLALGNLCDNNRSNMVYSLVKGLGTLRVDASDTLFPLKRMPAGLVEYVVNFFVANSPQKVHLTNPWQVLCLIFTHTHM